MIKIKLGRKILEVERLERREFINFNYVGIRLHCPGNKEFHGHSVLAKEYKAIETDLKLFVNDTDFIISQSRETAFKEWLEQEGKSPKDCENDFEEFTDWPFEITEKDALGRKNILKYKSVIELLNAGYPTNE